MMSKFQVYLHNIPPTSRAEYHPSGIRDDSRYRSTRVSQVQRDEAIQKRNTQSCRRPHTTIAIPRQTAAHVPVLRSRYCPGELNRARQGDRERIQRCESHTDHMFARPPDNRESSCDVTFLRKLLTLNKKEELLLNKKLAELLVEEEFSRSGDKMGKSFKGCTSSSTLSVYQNRCGRNSFVDKTVQGSPSRQFTRQPRYDMNGRRTFDDSDDEDKEEFEGRVEPTADFTTAESKTWINTTTVIQTKSDLTENMYSKKNSMTVVNKHPVLKTINEEKGDDSEERFYLRNSPFTTNDAAPGNHQSQRGDTDQIKVLGNLVGHCCAAVPSNPRKMTKKVWNFNNIPKTKPENPSRNDRNFNKTNGFDACCTYPCCKGDGSQKTFKEDRNCKLKNNRTRIFNQGDGRTRSTY
uniref:Uncharacterized protein n=1 Tax=Graphocephala atropunctata TaxID=36148 RepID=A0A1B6LBD8_9HEMI